MPVQVVLRLEASGVVPTSAQVQAVVSGWLDGADGHHRPAKPYTTAVVSRRDGLAELEVGLLDDGCLDVLVSRTATAGKLRLGRTDASLAPWDDGSLVRVRRRDAWTDLLDAASPQRYLRFEMLSPTAFRSGQVIDPLPRGERIFGHLRRRWQQFGPEHLQPFVDLSACGLVVSDLEGRTREARARNKRWPGFVGTVTVHAAGGDTRDHQVLDALARLAPYAGVGTSTTFGMGRVRYLRDARR